MARAEPSIGQVWEEEVQVATGYMKVHRRVRRRARMRVEQVLGWGVVAQHYIAGTEESGGTNMGWLVDSVREAGFQMYGYAGE